MKLLLTLILLFGLCLTTANAATAKREFIIDTDVGVDDAIAILYLAQQPDIHISAITIEADGNAHCKPAFANVLGLLQLVKQPNIPIACGRAIPLKGDHKFPAAILQESDTLANTPLVKPVIPKQIPPAKQLLMNTLTTAEYPVSILAIGPLTTIAQVLAEKPRLKNKIRRIYLMGGAVFAPGNVKIVDPKINNTVAEWNIFIDPYAAKQVFRSGVPITMVPLGVTNTVPIDNTFYERIKHDNHTPAANFVYELLALNLDLIKAKEWYFWDPMAAVVASDPSLVTTKTLPISIRLSPASQSGQTFIDRKHGTPIQVSTKIDAKHFKDRLLKGLNN
tara:strand:+ start:74019 stop:75023 length:1005 start_codon:yes stop_codon:yes gene_type:complete